MRYELIKDSNVGAIIDPTPILRDIKDTFDVSFLLPEEGAYIALFRDQEGKEYKAVIREGKAHVPKELITKEQTVGLTVCLTDGDAILHAWECHPLKVGTFLQLRQSQWQLTAGLTDADLFARLAELERVHANTLVEFAALKGEYTHHKDETARLVCSFKLDLYNQGERLASLKKANETLTAAYNKATEVINDLSKRVHALEKNYDPTIIS